MFVYVILIYILYSLSLLAIPERSTNVGDLIQPMPGVLYEDSKMKKGDPRRYKVNSFLYVFILYKYIFNRMVYQNMQVFMMKIVH